MQPPRPQARRSVRDAHESACPKVAPGFVPLPPAFSDAAAAGVLIAGLAVHDRLRRTLRPHRREAIGYMIASVSGLAGLEVQPVGLLVLVIAVVRPVVDSRGLTVRHGRDAMIDKAVDDLVEILE